MSLWPFIAEIPINGKCFRKLGIFYFCGIHLILKKPKLQFDLTTALSYVEKVITSELQLNFDAFWER